MDNARWLRMYGAADLFRYFERRPPTIGRLDRLAAEELTGKDRSVIWVVLDHWASRVTVS